MFTSKVKSYNLFELIQYNFVNIAFSFCRALIYFFFKRQNYFFYRPYIRRNISTEVTKKDPIKPVQLYTLNLLSKKKTLICGFSDFHTKGIGMELNFPTCVVYFILLYQIMSQQWSFDNKESLDVSPESNEMSAKH